MIKAWRESDWSERILFFAIALAAILFIFAVLKMDQSPSVCKQDANSVACLDNRVQECLHLERYSREECIALVGSRP